MSKFKISRKIELKFIGEEWKDCYLEFSPITASEIEHLEELKLENVIQEMKSG